MNDRDDLLRKLKKIRKLTAEVARDLEFMEPDDPEPTPGPNRRVAGAVCVPKQLPRELQLEAARQAIEINPLNSPQIGAMPLAALGAAAGDPFRIAVVTGKFWGPTPRTLSVRFLDTNSSALKSKILANLNAWSKTCGIKFAETRGTGQVRITRVVDGHWSYVGTDILSIPSNEATMNLEEFTVNTPDSEYRRVVRHEAGHTLGFPHEHMRRQLVNLIDRDKAFRFFRRTQGWDRATVEQQVLTSLDDRTIIGTDPDQTSIMCYQIPGEVTKNGRPILGGDDINDTDAAFAGRVYPKPRGTRVPLGADSADEDEMAETT